MKKYNGDLGALLEAQQNSIVGYSLEFRDIDTLQKIFGRQTKLNEDVQNLEEQIGMAPQTPR